MAHESESSRINIALEIDDPMKSLANWVVIPASLAIGLVLASLLSSSLSLTIIDFQLYYQASHLIWQGQNPYGAIEFFAPPWLALFLAPLLPLSIKFASAIWIIFSMVCIGAGTVLSQQLSGAPMRPLARQASLVFMLLTPAALFAYITGQLSALVVLAVLVAGGEFVRPRRIARGWLVAICATLATLKPNIIWLPVFLMALEVVRRRDWRTLAKCTLTIGLLAGISFVWLPTWPASLLAAWRGGAYRGGIGLVAAGYVGLSELGIPAWLFAPLLGYLFVYWWRDGLSLRVLALAFAMCLLVTPYSRSYDDVALILPSLAYLATPGGIKRWPGIALLIAAWVAPLLSLTVLAPILTSIAVLLAFPTLHPSPGATPPKYELTRS